MSDLSVLIIDGSRTVCGVVSKMLVDEGGSCAMCQSINTAIDTYWGKEYDAVML